MLQAWASFPYITRWDPGISVNAALAASNCKHTRFEREMWHAGGRCWDRQTDGSIGETENINFTQKLKHLYAAYRVFFFGGGFQLNLLRNGKEFLAFNKKRNCLFPNIHVKEIFMKQNEK
jgi:hypothetical protein